MKHLVQRQVFSVPPLGVEAPVDGAVLPDLVLPPRVVVAHLKDVSDHLGQLLVVLQLLFDVRRVRLRKSRRHPVHALQDRLHRRRVQGLHGVSGGRRRAQIRRRQAVLAVVAVARPEPHLAAPLQGRPGGNLLSRHIQLPRVGAGGGDGFGDLHAGGVGAVLGAEQRGGTLGQLVDGDAADGQRGERLVEDGRVGDPVPQRLLQAPHMQRLAGHPHQSHDL